PQPTTNKINSDPKNKNYHWCPQHNQWTIHTAAECKRLKPTRGKKDYYKKDKKAIKRQNFKNKKQAFIQAKAAYEACLGMDSDEEQDTMDSDNDEGYKQSASSYSSEASNDS
ncbi:MAG: hypothetical protein ACK53Y_03665, partial [bacterium]